MKIFRCTINGIESTKEIKQISMHNKTMTKLIFEKDIVYIDKFPKVFISKDEIKVYAKTEEDAKKIYIEESSKKITNYLNKMVKLQQSINLLQK